MSFYLLEEMKRGDGLMSVCVCVCMRVHVCVCVHAHVNTCGSQKIVCSLEFVLCSHHIGLGINLVIRVGGKHLCSLSY